MPTNNPFMPTPGTSRPAPAPSPAGAPLPGGASDSFEVDLTDVESQGLIPEGAYRARCANVEQSVSKGGNPMFVWDFELLEGDGKGRVLKVFTAITPAAMWKVAETVIALGVGQTGEGVKFRLRVQRQRALAGPARGVPGRAGAAEGAGVRPC